MIPGFNHNIKHKGRIYHIQTEDSGPKNPHIITHLFVGGNIVSSKKTTYADIVGKPEYEKTVRSMMEEQHKHMLRSLVNGAFDSVEVATAYHLDGPAPMNFTANSPATSAIAGASAFTGLPSQAGQAAAPAPAPQPVARTAVDPSREVTAPLFPPLPVPAMVTPPGSLPPGSLPPGSLPPRAGFDPSAPAHAAPAQGAPAQAAHAQAAPAAPDHVEEHKPAPGTLFGHELISEKSLDEVILSYLAEDLAEPE